MCIRDSDQIVVSLVFSARHKGVEFKSAGFDFAGAAIERATERAAGLINKESASPRKSLEISRDEPSAGCSGRFALEDQDETLAVCGDGEGRYLHGLAAFL